MMVADVGWVQTITFHLFFKNWTNNYKVTPSPLLSLVLLIVVALGCIKWVLVLLYLSLIFSCFLDNLIHLIIK
jgi:hypothetical protein